VDRDGKQYRVKIAPGEFASLDLSCEEARVEALDGEQQIQTFFVQIR
jgi:hypothetical protein